MYKGMCEKGVQKYGENKLSDGDIKKTMCYRLERALVRRLIYKLRIMINAHVQ